MVPYIDIPPLKLGPLVFQPFGILVATGILVGTWVGTRRGEGYGLRAEVVLSAAVWVLIGGFAGAHLAAVLFYHPERLLTDPLALFKVFKGISSFGGFLGGFLGLLLFVRRHRQPFARFADTVALGLLAGWIFGRMGCSVAHDHRGGLSDFWLAVAFPGGSRHDLGLYELLLTILLFIIFEFVRRRSLAPGRVALLLGLAYTPARFLLDFLRVDDARYFSLTPAQFGSAGLFVLCVLLLRKQKLS